MSTIYNSVASLLQERPLIILAPETTVREAARILSAHEVGAAPVLAEDRLVGVFTERDVLQRVVAAGRDPDLTLVRDVMTAEPLTVSAQTSLVRAFAIMNEGKFRHLPVVEGDGRVVAMLSMRDVPTEYRVLHRRWTEWTSAKPVPDALA